MSFDMIVPTRLLVGVQSPVIGSSNGAVVGVTYYYLSQGATNTPRCISFDAMLGGDRSVHGWHLADGE